LPANGARSIRLNPSLDAFLMELRVATLKFLIYTILWVLTFLSIIEKFVLTYCTFDFKLIFTLKGLFNAFIQVINEECLVWILYRLQWIWQFLHDLWHFLHILEADPCIFIKILVFLQLIKFFFVVIDLRLNLKDIVSFIWYLVDLWFKFGYLFNSFFVVLQMNILNLFNPLFMLRVQGVHLSL